MSSLPDDAPSPRLCIIVKWPDFEGYGFNLHAEKTKPGQYIGKVDDNSPAEVAGLREDDRIIEVNGVNIANENHKQVVQRIKSMSGETRLLVVDPQTDKYYKSKNIVVRGTQENVIVRSSAREQKAAAAAATPEPRSQPAATVSNGHHDEVDNHSVSSAASSSAASEGSTQPQHAATLAETTDAKVVEAATQEPMEDKKSRSPSPPPTEEAEKPSEEALAPKEDGASLNGSDKLSEKYVSATVEDSLPDASETDASHGKEPFEGREHTLPEANAPVEEEAQQPAEEEEEEQRSAEAAAAAPTADLESDLEAEYDNVEIGAGRAAGVPTEAASDTRRLSVSSGDSHSSHGVDTARTDPHTQSPMSTSPTPPPSLEPAPEPVRSSPPPASTTTTANARSQPNNNNTYNSSGLNLNMSAAEMRAKLASRKKADPRKDTVDLKKKYEIIQNM